MEFVGYAERDPAHAAVVFVIERRPNCSHMSLVGIVCADLGRLLEPTPTLVTLIDGTIGIFPHRYGGQLQLVCHC